ncbi:GTP cyclohydrolase I FolE [Peptostreptococcus equinus]|uniref:GTP cyclohydrolase 1 n=1 Tax=Peptostreptococcus equinus TaxID=3003601 RepID=A0ABY7JRN1_9FIRM|nr:GTP cyclohydrolase I FolE [Peptostreptococcus sp. CBA3647]WAW14347.1 GTP cyclohydrolase I FolE [Peptostreptococcus sp. CBA3647]
MVDIEKTQEAVRMLIEAIGEDPNREGLVETPKRVAKMYEEILAGFEEKPSDHLSRVFNSEDTDFVLEKDIQFYSMCEHHMMPFFGKVHIAYIPDGKVVGISKLGRLVDVYAKRLQIQEQMTVQIANAIVEELNPKGVMVIIEAEHTCMSMRGIKKVGAKTVTHASRGVFRTDNNLQATIRELIK